MKKYLPASTKHGIQISNKTPQTIARSTKELALFLILNLTVPVYDLETTVYASDLEAYIVKKLQLQIFAQISLFFLSRHLRSSHMRLLRKHLINICF